MSTQIATEGKPIQSASDYTSDPCCQEVLAFLKRHPHTHFSQLAIVHTLNSHRLSTERALSQLTASGAIIQYRRNNVLFYSLSAE
jgi:hypothetical protein